MKKFFAIFYLTTFATLAYANEYAESVVIETEGAHHAKTGGLPQLDPSSFSSQIFWVLLVFSFLYIFFAKKTLPSLSSVVEGRREMIQNDLDTAARLRKDVAHVQESYEKSLTSSRDDASTEYKNVESWIKTTTEDKTREFQHSSSKMIEKKSEQIDLAIQDALSDMNSIAVDIAIASAKKIINLDIDESYARSVVEKLNNNTQKSKAA